MKIIFLTKGGDPFFMNSSVRNGFFIAVAGIAAIYIYKRIIGSLRKAKSITVETIDDPEELSSDTQ